MCQGTGSICLTAHSSEFMVTYKRPREVGYYRPLCRMHIPEGHRCVYPKAKANKACRSVLSQDGDAAHTKRICSYAVGVGLKGGGWNCVPV